MEKFDFAAMGITLENVKELEEQLVEYKKSLKDADKSANVERKAKAIEAVNALIKDGSIVKGTSVVVMYNKQEVVGIIKNTPTTTAKNLPVNSDSFANKDKFLYVDKSAFCRLG